MMNKVAMAVESDVNYRGIIRAQAAEPRPPPRRHLRRPRQVAETLDLAAIVSYTASGSTAIRAAASAEKPILALSPNHRTVRRLSVVWGVTRRSPDAVKPRRHGRSRRIIAYNEGLARPATASPYAGIPLGTPGATNMLRIAFVRQDGAGSS